MLIQTRGLRPLGLMHRHMRQVQVFNTSNTQGDKTNTLFCRHINHNIHLMQETRIRSISLWIPCAQALVPERIRTLRLTAISQVRTWTTILLPTHRKSTKPRLWYANTNQHHRPALYPPTSYGMNDYRVSLPTMYPPTSTTPAAYPSYEPPHGIPPPPASNVPALSSSPSTQNSSVMPRVLNSRPKPQCFEHGCNGRQFSTFSNLLRHQREKSGTAAKSSCPRCHAEFTRTTAMKGHMQHDKCKARRPSDSTGMSR